MVQELPERFRAQPGGAGQDNWFVRTLGTVTNAPVIRHILREFSRPGFFVGNLIEGDIKNAFSVLMPFTDIDADEATSVSSVILPEGTHWLPGLAVDILTDPLTWTGIGGAARLGLRFGGLTKKGVASRAKTNFESVASLTAGGAKNTKQFKRLEKAAKRASLELDKIPGLADTLGAQAAQGQIGLVVVGGNVWLKGEKSLEALSKFGNLLRQSKPGKLLRAAFSRSTPKSMRAAETALFGNAAKLKHAADDKLKELNDLLKQMPRRERNGFYRKVEAQTGLRAKTPALRLATQLERDAAAKVVEINDLLKQFSKDVGIDVPELTGNLQKYIEVDLPKAMQEVNEAVAKGIETKWGPQLQKIQNELNKVALAAKGTPLEQTQIGAAVIDAARADIVRIVGAPLGQTQQVLDKILPLLNSDLKAIQKLTGLSEKSVKELQGIARTAQIISQSLSGKLFRIGDEGVEIAAMKLPLTQAIQKMDDADLQILLSNMDGIQQQSGKLFGFIEENANQIARLQKNKAAALEAMQKAPTYLSHIGTRAVVEAAANQRFGRKVIGSTDFVNLMRREWMDRIEGGVGRPWDIDEVTAAVLDVASGKRKNFLSGETTLKFLNAISPRTQAKLKKIRAQIDSGEIQDWGDAIDKGLVPEAAKYFETDVGVIQATLAKRTIDAVNAKTMLNATTQQFGVQVRRVDDIAHKLKPGVKVVDEAPEGFRTLTIADDEVADVLFREDIAIHLERRHDVFTNMEVITPFLRTFDSIQGWLKANMTVMWLGFHARNSISNKLLNIQGGMNPVRPEFAGSYIQAFRLQRFAQNPVRFTNELKQMSFKVAGDAVDGHEMLDILIRGRALSDSAMWSEFPNVDRLGRVAARQTLASVTGTPFTKWKKMGIRLGSSVEDNDRIAHMLYKMSVDGMDEISAGQSAMRTLLDYREGLTHFENQVMKRLFPFYAWSSLIIPSMFKSLAMNPNRAPIFTKVIEGVSIDEAIPEDLIPAWVHDQMGIPVSIDRDGNPNFLLLQGVVPIGELDRIPFNGQDLFDEVMTMLTPILKIPIEQGFNRSTFFKREITEFEGQKTEWLGFKGFFTRRQRHTLGVIRALNEIDNFIRITPLASDFRKRQATEAVTKFVFGMRPFKVDLERQKARVEFQSKRDKATLQGQFNRARKVGDVGNMAAVLTLAEREGIQLKTERAEIKEQSNTIEDIEKRLRSLTGNKLFSDTFSAESIQRRIDELEATTGG